jgi:hypothetical protein
MRHATPIDNDILLAHCSGFCVEASDGVAGVVETPLFPPDEAIPDFLVLRVGGRLRPQHPVLPAALVEHVDPEAQIVHVHGTRGEILRLPEHLPLAI